MKQTTKKLMTTLFALVLLFAASALAVSAEERTPNSDGYYEISNVDDLVWFANQVNEVEGKSNIKGKLTNNIDLTNSWTPIGTSSNPYLGTFDGNGETVSSSQTNDVVALFGHIAESGIVKNVAISGKKFYRHLQYKQRHDIRLL